MAIVKKVFVKGIQLQPDDVAFDGIEGELKVGQTSKELEAYLDGASRTVVTEDQVQSLENKSIDADDNSISNLEVDNLKSGVLNTSTSLAGATDAQIPSALAVKTYVDNSTGGVQTDVDDLITLSGRPANSTDLGTFTGTVIPDGSDNKEALQALETFADMDAFNLASHIVNPTGAHAASAISNTPSGNLAATTVQAALNELQGDIDTINNTSLPAKVTGPASATDEAIVRFDGTTGKLVQNSVVTITDAGAVAGVTSLTATGTVQQATSITTGTFRMSELTDNTTTGANATLNSIASPEIRLTNSSLTSLDAIPAGAAGQIITLSNLTGNAVTVNNDTGATAANRIYTGTSASLTLSNQATLILRYDSTSARWLVIGGTGAGTGQALDTIFQLDASEQLSTWATGDNATFLGGGTLAGTFVKETSSPLNGLASYKYTQAAGSLDDYIASPVYSVPVRFRGNPATISFPYLYDGAASDINVVIWCATSGTQLNLTTDLLPTTGTNTSIYRLNVTIPSTCQGLRFGFQVKALNSGKILQFDDVVVSSNTTTYFDSLVEQTSYLASAGSFGTATITGALTSSIGSSLYTYNSGTGIYTVTQPCSVTLTASFAASGAASVRPQILVNGTAVAQAMGLALVGYYVTTTYTGILNAGDNFRFNNGQGTTNAQNISVLAQTNTPNIVTASESFSSDTASFVYAGSSQYTLATLSDAPVCTFITWTYAINSNTLTQTNAAAPSQSTSDMSLNGFRIFARPYNAASTSGNPARVAIQIGKNYNGLGLTLYKTTTKDLVCEIDHVNVSGGTIETGLNIKDYNPVTGVLVVDAGYHQLAANTTQAFIAQDNSSTTDGYLRITASKSPALVGVPQVQPRFATIKDVKANNTGGGTGSTSFATRTLNTLEDPTGIVTSLSSNQFTLPPGEYFIEVYSPHHGNLVSKAKLRNITDSTDDLISMNVYGSGSDADGRVTYMAGRLLLTSSKVFEVQQRAAQSVANGWGIAANFSVSEIYTTVKIEKIK